MNSEELLRHFEQIADAPDAIGRLRRFVLDLAVRGELVLRDPSEESGEALFRRLTETSTGLRNSGAVPKERQTSSLDGDPPFSLPEGWRWVAFGAVHQLVRGVTYSKSDVSEVPADGFVPILRANNIGVGLTHDEPVYVRQVRVAAEQFLRQGDFMIAMSSGSKNLVGKAAFVPQDFAEGFGGFCGVIRLHDPCIQPFVAVYLRSDLYRESIAAGSRGIGINNLKKETISNLHFPLPPLAEQRRIVAKVDELMALCDQLEVARAEREAARDRLAAASLARLNAADPETFADDVRFALDALPALTARSDQSKLLRQTIINLAVRGKLVAQKSLDEPASVLISRILSDVKAFAMRHRLGTAVAEPIEAGDEPFDIPASWRWVRLAELFRVITDGDHQPPPRAENGVAFLTIGNVTTGSLDFTGCRLVPREYFSSLAPYRTPARGDILYTVVGATFGRAALVETDREFCVQRHIAILKPAFDMSLRYLVWLLSSPLIYDQAVRSITGAAQPTIALRPLRRFMAPVPPRAEQDRIVAKVQELMTVCDQLEASLLAGVEHRSRLLEVLLRIAVESGNRADAPARVDEAAAA